VSYPTCAFISAGRLNGGDDCTNLNRRLDAVVTAQPSSGVGAKASRSFVLQRGRLLLTLSGRRLCIAAGANVFPSMQSPEAARFGELICPIRSSSYASPCGPALLVTRDPLRKQTVHIAAFETSSLYAVGAILVAAETLTNGLTRQPAIRNQSARADGDVPTWIRRSWVFGSAIPCASSC
jgi:hypothetical protein